MLWRGAAVAAGVMLALGVLVAPAGAAPAAAERNQITPAAMSDCPSSYFCVWVNSDFNDGPGKWQNNEGNYANWPHGTCQTGNWGNCASSVYNHGNSCRVSFYDGVNGTGAFYFALPRGSFLANLALDHWSDGSSPNDKISSHQWVCP